MGNKNREKKNEKQNKCNNNIIVVSVDGVHVNQMNSNQIIINNYKNNKKNRINFFY